MWKKSNQSINSGPDSVNLVAGRGISITLNLDQRIPIDLIDEKIEEKVANLCKSRLFKEFDSVKASLSLGKNLVKGNLSSGSDAKRSWGLAWCTRVLSRSENLDQAEEYLSLAKTLGNSPAIKVAEAFMFSQKGDKKKALQKVASINMDISRSAGLVIVADHDGFKGAIQWMNDTGYTPEQLDSDGKAFLLICQLELGHWNDAVQTVDSIIDVNFEETPALHHLTGLTYLITAVPAEFRVIVRKQVPFELVEFRLASDAIAMVARRTAHGHFLNGVEAAKKLGCLRTANR